MKRQLAIVIFSVIVTSNAFAAEVDRAAVLAEAIKTAGQIQDRDARADALVEIAVAQARTGDVNGARRTAQDIDPLRNKELASAQIAMGCAGTGDIEGARSMLDTVSNDVAKSAILGSIANAQARKGDVVATRAAARLVTGAFKAEADLNVALAQAKAGDIAGAEATIASVVGVDSLKVEVLVEIALAQSKSNDKAAATKTIARARALTEKISPDPVRPFPLIAGAQTKLGDLPGAMATAQRGKNDVEKSMSYGFISEAQLDMNDIPGAKVTIAKTKDGITQINFLCRLSLAQRESRDAAGAAQSLEAAKLAFGKLSIPEQSVVCRVVASTQTESGDAAGAVAWARSVEAPGIRVRALCGVVAGLVTMESNK